jgi:hypothetical protein
LPGEAQKVDRLMEKFASRYCASNPNQVEDGYGSYLRIRRVNYAKDGTVMRIQARQGRRWIRRVQPRPCIYKTAAARSNPDQVKCGYSTYQTGKKWFYASIKPERRWIGLGIALQTEAW